MTLVLDAGALIALDRLDRRVVAHVRVAHQNDTPVVTSAAAAAQVWRDGARQANLVRMLRGVHVAKLSEQTYRGVGELLAASATSDVPDAHLAGLATAGDTVLTSDPDDINALLDTRGVRAIVIRV